MRAGAARRWAVPIEDVAGCEAPALERAVRRVNGVRRVRVNAATGCAYVDLAETAVIADVTRAIDGTGHRAGSPHPLESPAGEHA